MVTPSKLRKYAAAIEDIEDLDIVASADVANIEQSAMDVAISLDPSEAEARIPAPQETFGSTDDDLALETEDSASRSTPTDASGPEEATADETADDADTADDQHEQADDTESYCGYCGEASPSPLGVKIHTGHTHEGVDEAIVLEDPPAPEELADLPEREAEDGADDAESEGADEEAADTATESADTGPETSHETAADGGTTTATNDVVDVAAPGSPGPVEAGDASTDEAGFPNLPALDIPEGLTRAEVEAAVDDPDAETLVDVANGVDADVSVDTLRPLLVNIDRYGDLNRPEGGRR